MKKYMDNLEEQIKYWKKSAEKDWKTVLVLFHNKRYDACLFFCHLVIEKLLKGLVVMETKNVAPYIHNLEKLAHLAGLTISEDKVSNLRTITGFNLAGRYDGGKFAFYKICNKDYTAKYVKISKELIIWLKKEYLKY